MNRLARFGFLGALTALSIATACSSDKETNDGPYDDDAGAGGSSASGGSANAGGSNAGGSNAGGSNAGGSDPGAGGSGAGGDPQVPACDLAAAGRTPETLPTSITANMTLTADKVYTVEGIVHVESGATLTIEPCTRIEGTKTPIGVLVVSRGGKIMAEGEADRPILFTSKQPAGSREAGDWGGVVILGNAGTNDGEARIEGLEDIPANRYGGNDDADDSGTMKYVRIEYAGYELEPNVEVNGLTMGAVGSATDISYIQVNRGLDDCFEWFGGTVNADHLVCNTDGDDMFDMDRGYRGTVEYIFGRKRDNPSSDPNGFEWDNNNNDNALTPVTDPTVRHATLCGFGSDASVASFGMVLRRGVQATIDDVVAVGFDYGVDLRNDHGTQAAPKVTITNSVYFDMELGAGNAGIADPAETDDDALYDEVAWFTTATGNTGNGTADPGFNSAACQDDTGPTAAVTGSNKGAFNGGNWLTGMWLDWSDN